MGSPFSARVWWCVLAQLQTFFTWPLLQRTRSVFVSLKSTNCYRRLYLLPLYKFIWELSFQFEISILSLLLKLLFWKTSRRLEIFECWFVSSHYAEAVGNCATPFITFNAKFLTRFNFEKNYFAPFFSNKFSVVVIHCSFKSWSIWSLWRNQYAPFEAREVSWLVSEKLKLICLTFLQISNIYCSFKNAQYSESAERHGFPLFYFLTDISWLLVWIAKKFQFAAFFKVAVFETCVALWSSSSPSKSEISGTSEEAKMFHLILLNGFFWLIVVIPKLFKPLFFEVVHIDD